MNKLTNILDRIPLDNKLLSSLAAVAVTRALVALIRPNQDEDLLSFGLPLAVGAVVGYQTHNEGSVLRRADAEDGNPILPENESVPGEGHA